MSRVSGVLADASNLGVVRSQKGSFIKDNRKEGEGFDKYGHLQTGVGVKDLADVRKLVLLSFQYVLRTLSMPSCLFVYPMHFCKLLFIPSLFPTDCSFTHQTVHDKSW